MEPFPGAVDNRPQRVHRLVKSIVNHHEVELMPMTHVGKSVPQAALNHLLRVGAAVAKPALKLILQHMPATVELALVSLMMAIVLGIPLGLYAGLYPEQKVSKAIMAGSILGQGYLAGFGMTIGTVFGRIAGREAASYAN